MVMTGSSSLSPGTVIQLISTAPESPGEQGVNRSSTIRLRSTGLGPRTFVHHPQQNSACNQQEFWNVSCVYATIFISYIATHQLDYTIVHLGATLFYFPLALLGEKSSSLSCQVRINHCTNRPKCDSIPRSRHHLSRAENDLNQPQWLMNLT